MRTWTRRELLATASATATATLAGCTAFLSGDANSDEVPVTGSLPAEFAPLDDTVREWFRRTNTPGGVLGVSIDGETSFVRGYGYRDESLTRAMEPSTTLRIASLSKTFTRAAIHHLREEGSLELDDRAFDRLGLSPLPGESETDGIGGITIGHLLSHRGGWDRTAVGDPVFSQGEIALERGWSAPPTARALVRSQLSEPLQFAPGTGQRYSNLGYLVLGLVVEAVTGVHYQQFLEDVIFEPLADPRIEVGRSVPEGRPDRETWYFTDRVCWNVAELKPLELVRCADGGFYLEGSTASGGHVVTVRSFLQFMQEYWLNGRRRDGRIDQRWQYSGTLPGTDSLAVQQGGVDLVFVANQRQSERTREQLRQDFSAIMENDIHSR